MSQNENEQKKRLASLLTQSLEIADELKLDLVAIRISEALHQLERSEGDSPSNDAL